MNRTRHPRPRARITPEAVTKSIQLRIPPAYIELIRAAANDKHMTISAYIRDAALTKALADLERIGHALALKFKGVEHDNND